MSDELYHHGIKGMKWGVRRTPEQLGHKVTKQSVKKKIDMTRIEKRNFLKMANHADYCKRLAASNYKKTQNVIGYIIASHKANKAFKKYRKASVDANEEIESLFKKRVKSSKTDNDATLDAMADLRDAFNNEHLVLASEKTWSDAYKTYKTIERTSSNLHNPSDIFVQQLDDAVNNMMNTKVGSIYKKPYYVNGARIDYNDLEDMIHDVLLENIDRQDEDLFYGRRK